MRDDHPPMPPAQSRRMHIERRETGATSDRSYRSTIDVPVDVLDAWHRAPGAFARLTPPWMPVRVTSGDPNPAPGNQVTLRIPLFGPVAVRWTLSHTDLTAGIGFADSQTSGPFRSWRHEHRFLPEGDTESVLDDHLTYQLPFGSLGAGLIGAQLDSLFAFRHERTQADLRRHRATGLEHPMNIVVSGATGLVGSHLVPFLRSGGHEVRTLVRHEPKSPDEIFWSPSDHKIDAAALEGIDAVIHLAGASIASGRWTDARKKAILDSRVDGTTLLANTLAHLEAKPKVFVSTSAVGYYGSRGDMKLTEQSAAGEGFLVDVVKAWESAADPAREAGIRVVHPRFGVVMSGSGGMLPLLAKVFRAGIGGKLGDGQQYFAWIDIDDLIGILLESVVDEELAGPVNAVAPQQVTNKEFTKTMGHVLHRPTIFSVPAFAMKTVAGELADDLILASQRVVPARLEEIDFRFAYPTLESSLQKELGAS